MVEDGGVPIEAWVDDSLRLALDEMGDFNERWGVVLERAGGDEQVAGLLWEILYPDYVTHVDGASLRVAEQKRANNRQ